MASELGARTLHMVSRMKATVGILAATLFLGCGVGVDDVEGQLAAYGHVQFVQPLSEDGQGAAGTSSGTTGSATARNAELQSLTSRVESKAQSAAATGDTVNSPVDPIPAFDPRFPGPPGVEPYPGL